MSESIIKKLAAAVLAILLLLYVGCQFYNASSSKIKTETAEFMTAENAVEASGFIIRQEDLLTGGTAGVINYLVSDGEKISAGGTIAEVFSNAGDAAAQNEENSLQSQIDRLKQLNHPSSSFATSPDLLDKQINRNIIGLISGMREENYLQLGKNRDSLLYLLNERQIITGKVQDFNARIDTLQSGLSTLQNGHGGRVGTITAPNEGYFVSRADGYENAYDYNNVLSLTPDQLKASPKKEAAQAGAIGKVVGGLHWYIACVLPAQQAASLTVGMDGVSIRLPFASSQRIPVQVAAVNQANKLSEAAVILQCDYMNSELAGIRQETVQISTDSISGIRVSERAVHVQKLTREVTNQDGGVSAEEKEVQGVYVRSGSELEFKEIAPLYSSGGFIICDQDQKSERLFSGSTIRLYDEIVVEGTDLYDGKIVG